MRRILAGVVVIALVTPWLLFGQAKPQQAAPSKGASVEQQLIQLEDKWGDAMVKGDMAFLDRILADDFVNTDIEGSVTTKTREIADLKSGELKVSSSVSDEYKVRVYGKAAVVTGRCTFKAQYKGKDSSSQFHWTDTWVKRAGQWQCVASQQSRIVEKQ